MEMFKGMSGNALEDRIKKVQEIFMSPGGNDMLGRITRETEGPMHNFRNNLNDLISSTHNLASAEESMSKLQTESDKLKNIL